jgi:hypothetical protein
MKTFKFFGTATRNGKTGVKGCADMASRVITMERDGFTNVVFVELPHEMDKVAGCNFIVTHASFQTIEQQDAIKTFLANNDDVLPQAVTSLPVAEEGVDYTFEPEAPATEPEAPATKTKKAPKAKKAKVAPVVAEVQQEVAPETAPETDDNTLDAALEGKVIDLGDDDFGSNDDDFGLGDYAGMIDNYDIA